MSEAGPVVEDSDSEEPATSCARKAGLFTCVICNAESKYADATAIYQPLLMNNTL